jgi:ABC-type bacteriocin/lantibiotic exporter with double-glycine peptidase domain
VSAQGCASSGYTSTQELRASLSPTAVVLDVPIVSQETNTLCGLACLDALLRFNGAALDTQAQTQFDAERVAASDGITAGELRSYLHTRGFRAVLVHGRLDRSRPTGLLGLIEKGLPPIVELVTKALGEAPLHHYVVVCGFDPNSKTVYVMDPAEGLRGIPYAGFEEQWRPAGRLTLVAAAGAPPNVD